MSLALSQPSNLWLGPDFACGADGGAGRARLLIVAERLPEDASGFRVGRGLEASLTGSYLDGSAKNRQFTDLARAVLGTAAPREACEEFFRQVAFANLPEPSTGSGLAEPLSSEPLSSEPLSSEPLSSEPLSSELTSSEQDLRKEGAWLLRLVTSLVPEQVLLVGSRCQDLAGVLSTPGAPQGLRVCSMAHPASPGFDFRVEAESLGPLRGPRGDNADE